MAEPVESYRVWCVLGSNVERYGSGPRANPWVSISAVYELETEAIEYATGRNIESRKNGLWPTDRPGEAPIAWLVTFIILSNESGEAMYGIQPCYGGTVNWNDDRDVMAIFPTENLAKEYAAWKSGSA